MAEDTPSQAMEAAAPDATDAGAASLDIPPKPQFARTASGSLNPQAVCFTPSAVTPPPPPAGKAAKGGGRSRGNSQGNANPEGADGGSGGQGGGQEAEAVVLTPEVQAALIKQVEFYFSDENLPTDTFMRDHMRKGKQGAVPLHIIASFRKVKQLCKNQKAIAAALRQSEVLVVEKHKKSISIRRKVPYQLPEAVSVEDVRSRTVEAVNIPKDSTEESLKELFGRCGDVERVTIMRQDDPRNAGKMRIGAPREVYATCQYVTTAQALAAVKKLTDTQNWRGGLRVAMLRHVSDEGGKAGGDKRDKKGRDKDRQRDHGDGHDSRHSSRHTSPVPLKRERSYSDHLTMAFDKFQDKQDFSSTVNGTEDTGPARGRKPRSVSVAEGPMPHARTPKPSKSPTPIFELGATYEGRVEKIQEGRGGSIKGHNKAHTRYHFSMADVEDGGSLQQGDLVQYRAWRNDISGNWCAIQIKKVGSGTPLRPDTGLSTPSNNNGSGGGAPGSGRDSLKASPRRRLELTMGGFRTDAATQKHFRLAKGPIEGRRGFAVGRGRGGGTASTRASPTRASGPHGGFFTDSQPPSAAATPTLRPIAASPSQFQDARLSSALGALAL